MVLLGNQAVKTTYVQNIFVTGKKLDVFNTPNYVPSIQANNPETIKESNAAMVHF